jgi:hypothetical protein
VCFADELRLCGRSSLAGVDLEQCDAIIGHMKGLVAL